MRVMENNGLNNPSNEGGRKDERIQRQRQRELRRLEEARDG
jgi:hypothetical protein